MRQAWAANAELRLANLVEDMRDRETAYVKVLKGIKFSAAA